MLLRRSSLILFAVVLQLACREGYRIVDDFGPPAGYAAVQGTIRYGSGVPTPNTRVTFTRCANPIGGSFGEDISDHQGGYRVDGSLPPDVLPRATLDTLRVRCDVFVGPLGAEIVVDTLSLRFAASRDSVVPSVRDLTLP
jgi:hypothetical protein